MGADSIVKEIVQDLFSIKRAHEDGMVVISYKVEEALDFAERHSFQEVRTFGVKDSAIVEETRDQLKNGKMVLIVADMNLLQYSLYQSDW